MVARARLCLNQVHSRMQPRYKKNGDQNKICHIDSQNCLIVIVIVLGNDKI